MDHFDQAISVQMPESQTDLLPIKPPSRTFTGPGAAGNNAGDPYELVLRPRSGWIAIDWQELWAYRELLWFLVWRDIAVRYKQTVLGSAWAIVQPLVLMVIFTVIFGRFRPDRFPGLPIPGVCLCGPGPVDHVLARVPGRRALAW